MQDEHEEVIFFMLYISVCVAFLFLVEFRPGFSVSKGLNVERVGYEGGYSLSAYTETIDAELKLLAEGEDNTAFNWFCDLSL